MSTCLGLITTPLILRAVSTECLSWNMVKICSRAIKKKNHVPWSDIAGNPESKCHSLRVSWLSLHTTSVIVLIILQYLRKQVFNMMHLRRAGLMFKTVRFKLKLKSLFGFAHVHFYLFKAWDPIFFWASVKGLLSIRNGTMSWWWTTQNHLWQLKQPTCVWAGRPRKGTPPTPVGVRSGAEMALEMTSFPMDLMACIFGQVSNVYSPSQSFLKKSYPCCTFLKTIDVVYTGHLLFTNLTLKWWMRMLSKNQNFTWGKKKTWL